MIETCLVMMLTGLIFAGLFQISQLFAARAILGHAANRSARAQTVGFNNWMVRKANRVAAIPNAGRMIVPDVPRIDTGWADRVRTQPPGTVWDEAMQSQPVSHQLDVELARIPEYLASDNPARARFVLDYEDWDTVHVNVPASLPGILHIRAYQNYPLRIPLHRAYYAADHVRLQADSYIENHSAEYIDDMSL